MNTLKIGDKFYCRYGYDMTKWKVIAIGKYGVLAKEDTWFFPYEKFFYFEDMEGRDFIQL